MEMLEHFTWREWTTVVVLGAALLYILVRRRLAAPDSTQNIEGGRRAFSLWGPFTIVVVIALVVIWFIADGKLKI